MVGHDLKAKSFQRMLLKTSAPKSTHHQAHNVSFNVLHIAFHIKHIYMHFSNGTESYLKDLVINFRR